MGIERVYISSVWAEGFGYRQVLHTKQRYTLNKRIKEICKDIYLVLQFCGKKNIHHSASADGRRKNLGSGGEILFLPLSFSHFFSNPNVLP